MKRECLCRRVTEYRLQWCEVLLEHFHAQMPSRAISPSNSSQNLVRKLCQMLEQGWIHEYGERSHFHPETPLSQTKQLLNLKYFISRATAGIPFSDDSPVMKTLKKTEESTMCGCWPVCVWCTLCFSVYPNVNNLSKPHLTSSDLSNIKNKN